MAFDTSRLRFGDMIAAGSALVLFISLFLDWYNVSVEGLGGLGGSSQGGNAWDALGPGDFFLLLVALAVIGIVVVRALGVEPAGLPVPLSTIVLALGALAALYVLFRLIVTPVDVPDALDDAVDVGRSIGVFLAFLATLGITAGGFLSARERGDAIPGIGGGTGASPLGGGQPAGGAPATTSAPAGTGTPAGGAPAGGAPAGGAPAGGGAPAPDWYPDPQGQARLRYWDGSQWTDQTAD
jgi:hypothetical protein